MNYIQIKSFLFSEKTGVFIGLSGLMFIVITIIMFIFFSDWTWSSIIDEAKLGQFGDLIGGVVGSIFTLASVILFYVALIEQRKDININQKNLKLQVEALNHQVEEFKAQKQELIETRKVYEEQTILFREQTESQKQQVKESKLQSIIYNLQQFDSSFYSILNVLIKLKDKFDAKFEVQSCFEFILSNLSSVVIKDKNISDSIKLILEKYHETYYTNEIILSQYYLTICRILRLIDDSNIAQNEKNRYVEIVLSQLSSTEQLLLYYHCLTSIGNEIKILAVKYNFFNHINLLERIENRLPDDIKSNFKFKHDLFNFNNTLNQIISINLKKVNDIEEENDICISETIELFEIKSQIELLIDLDFDLSVSFDKTMWDNTINFHKELLIRQISLTIIDVFCLSKYKPVLREFITTNIVESDLSAKLDFKINNIKDI